MRPSPSHILLTLATVAVLSASPLSAQSILNGSLAGVVRTEDGSTISRASVIVRSLDLGLERALVADIDGRFHVGFVIPGSYEVRVESLGYLPLLVRPVTVSAGDVRNLVLRLRSSSGAVLQVDTLTLPGAGVGARLRNGGFRLGQSELEQAPNRDGDLGSAASLFSTVDAHLGMEGLPGSLSTLWLDGVPFTPAGHPTRRVAALASPAIPRTAIGSLDVLGNAADAEWGGSAGAYLAMTSASSVPQEGAALHGSWSGDPLWNSSDLSFDPPTMNSIWARGAISVDIAQDTSRLFVSGDFQQRQLPTAPRFSDAAALAGLGAEVISGLSNPALETVTRMSALARLDWWFSPQRRFQLRAAGGRLERDYEGPGRLGGGILGQGPLEATDATISAALVTEYDDRITVEARGGISTSARTYTGSTGRAAAFLVNPAVQLGDGAGGPATTSRIDVFFSPIAHITLADGAAGKAGVQVRASQHTVDHSNRSGAGYLFGSVASVGAGVGNYVSSVAPEENFGTSEIGLFAQYSMDAAPGLRLAFGGRYDLETIPSGATFNSDWLVASGIRNDTIASSFRQIQGRASVAWDVLGDGRTRVVADGSIQYGDVDWSLLHQLFTEDGSATVTRATGAGMAWPATDRPAGATTLPVLSLFGPDMRPPRSVRSSAGLVQEMGGGWNVFVEGSVRRTDFLARRRNLNLTVIPVGEDANGRVLLGDMIQQGGLVTADLGSNRRFTGFDDVWAIDPDGWSEYRGLTGGLEFSGETSTFLASYTRSSTQDNWFGAGAGDRAAELVPALSDDLQGWDEGTSDFDLPHRATAFGAFDFGNARISGVYRYTSARPFTAGFRTGVDVNGDGSGLNDAAFVPSVDQLGGLDSKWQCLRQGASRFATRNACRGPAVHSLDARLEFKAGEFSGRAVMLTVDGLGLIEPKDGLRDTALLLVDPNGSITTSADGTVVTLPLMVNPDFGEVLVPVSRGRILRIGVRIGGLGR